MTTPKLLAVRPWNCNREWRGEDKPIQHTAHCCQLYRETEKNSIRLFYSHTTYIHIFKAWHSRDNSIPVTLVCASWYILHDIRTDSVTHTYPNYTTFYAVTSRNRSNVTSLFTVRRCHLFCSKGIIVYIFSCNNIWIFTGTIAIIS